MKSYRTNNCSPKPLGVHNSKFHHIQTLSSTLYRPTKTKLKIYLIIYHPNNYMSHILNSNVNFLLFQVCDSKTLCLNIMGIEVEARKPHVLVIPCPAQGHINPSLAFAKCLASKGLQITLLITTNVANTAKLSECSSVTIASISDGSEQVKDTETVDAYLKRLRDYLSHNLARFIDDQRTSSNCARAVIYDSVMPWVQDITRERGLLCASFFTQTCAVSAVFYHIKQGLLRYPYEGTVSLPALPSFEIKHLPSFSFLPDTNDHTIMVKQLGDQFLNLEKADWIFFNTFHKLESEIIEWMRSRWPTIKTVGPTFLLDHNNQNHTISLFEPKQDACREWLDSREAGSVVYVSFGSIASLGKEQMEEVAYGLILSDCNFLWVVRSSEGDKLPQDFNSEKGLIIGWCHQPEVLAHRSLACFMTHCGWNSTLEALCNGVPLIAMPQLVDQNTNAKFVEDVWRVGVGVKGGENGIIGREEIAMCIKQVVGGDKGIELKRNACMWKELCGEAVQNGGTSANDIDDFVSKLIFSDRDNISPTSVLIGENRDGEVVVGDE